MYFICSCIFPLSFCNLYMNFVFKFKYISWISKLFCCNYLNKNIYIEALHLLTWYRYSTVTTAPRVPRTRTLQSYSAVCPRLHQCRVVHCVAVPGCYSSGSGVADRHHSLQYSRPRSSTQSSYRGLNQNKTEIVGGLSACPNTGTIMGRLSACPRYVMLKTYKSVVMLKHGI